MKETSGRDYQVISGGRTVWVNERTGGAVARLSSFGNMEMVDVHRPLQQQCAEGECLDCRHDLSGVPAWDYFVRSVLMHFGLITETHRPRWAKPRG